MTNSADPKNARPSGRAAHQLRDISIETGVARHAEGSCLVKFGHTHVLVTASLEEKVPPWLRGGGKGWVTAEYGMLPRATHTRGRREAAAGKQSGRTQEIQRLIGRALRSVVDLVALGERQITIDCDVIQADGGTRTASITGAYVALKQAIAYLMAEGLLASDPVRAPVAAISCGIYQNIPVADLDYAEDSNAEADANFVLSRDDDGSLALVEVQATGEERPIKEAELQALLALAKDAAQQLFAVQEAALKGA